MRQFDHKLVWHIEPAMLSAEGLACTPMFNHLGPYMPASNNWKPFQKEVHLTFTYKAYIGYTLLLSVG